jgi:hypothetical protein
LGINNLWLGAVSLSNNGKGITVGQGGYIYRTVDGGINWQLVTNTQGVSLYDVQLIDTTDGVAVGSNGVIYKTTDGGITWIQKSSGTPNLLWSVFFTDTNHGTIVGGGGTVLRTIDGGETWIQQYLETNIILRSVSFKDVNNGVAVGSSGSILRTTNGGVTFIEEEPTPTQPNSFLLSQNYPNPFNPSTKIKFEIPGQARNDNVLVTLKVYDVLGNRVTTLVNEYKSAGSYNVEFNATELPSGIYFYQLRAGEYVETKKMILLK